MAELAVEFDCEAVGIDSSEDALDVARAQFSNDGIYFQKGSADAIDFPNEAFDLVFFGFSLFLCDREDLFKIAFEADRVLRDGGHICILDFDTTCPFKRRFYDTELYSHKMNYSSMFAWNPAYSLMAFRSLSYQSEEVCADANERLGIYLLKKDLISG